MSVSILITGANGFIGNSICDYLLKRNFDIIGIVRDHNFRNNDIKIKFVKTINNQTNWKELLKKIDIVIHTAGMAGLANRIEKSVENLNQINVWGTINLAKQAVENGVKKFIYISSAQVHGEITNASDLISIDSPYNPKSYYAMSKVEAEKGLQTLRKKSNMDIIIVRPPLVYGYGVKSNFSRLINLIKEEKFLPFKLLNNNKLSFISLDNLNDFIYECISFKGLINSNFLIRDPDLVSTKCLIEEIAFANNVKPKLYSVPVLILSFLAIFFNQRKSMKKLTTNFEIDISFAKKKLNWEPKINLKDGLRKMNNTLLKS